MSEPYHVKAAMPGRSVGRARLHYLREFVAKPPKRRERRARALRDGTSVNRPTVQKRRAPDPGIGVTLGECGRDDRVVLSFLISRASGRSIDFCAVRGSSPMTDPLDFTSLAS